MAAAAWRRAMWASSGSQASAGRRCTAREDMWERQACQTATGMAQAMADSETGADAYLEECRFPWSETGRWATAGSFAARRRAAAGGGSGSAFARAAGAAGPAEGTGCSWGRPWWAARPLQGVAQAKGTYRRVIRRRRVLRIVLGARRRVLGQARWVEWVGASRLVWACRGR
jgi:hypothetical protein